MSALSGDMSSMSLCRKDQEMYKLLELMKGPIRLNKEAINSIQTTRHIINNCIPTNIFKYLAEIDDTLEIHQGGG